MSPAVTRSAWALTVLSLLNEQPMHPYEMRRIVRHRGKDEHLELKPGSLYRTIEQLERAGLVELTERTREGRFPERTVYRITEHGRDELEEWLRDTLSTLQKDLPQLVAALSFLPHLEPLDAAAQLEKRVVRLEMTLAAMDAARQHLSGLLPRLFMVEEEYARAMRAAELEFTRGLLADLRSGNLAWSCEELRRTWGGHEHLPLSALQVVADEHEGEDASIDSQPTDLQRKIGS